MRGVDLAEMERLLDFMQKHGLEQLEYERDGVRVLLKKGSGQPGGQRHAAPPVETASQPASPAVGHREAPSQAVAQPPATAKGDVNLHVIKSPIVGTFYAAASPDAESFVTVGAHVEPGQVLCIIEAMKLMNEIESDVAGKVTKILSENGNPVEYGEPLFEISPDRKK